MSFRASIATQNSALLNAMQYANYVKTTLQGMLTLLQGNVTPDQIFQMVDNLRSALGQLNAAAAVPGIGAYAQAQFNDATYVVATEFTNMVNSINAVIAWVVTNFPKGTGNFLQAATINADGSRTPNSFTPAQTAGLVTAINACIATIS